MEDHEAGEIDCVNGGSGEAGKNDCERRIRKLRKLTVSHSILEILSLFCVCVLY